MATVVGRVLRTALWGRPLWAWFLAAVAVGSLFWPVPLGPLSDPTTVTWMLIIAVPTVAGLLLLGRPGMRRNGGLMVAEAAFLSVVELQWVPTGPWQQMSYVLYPMTGIPLAILLLRWPAERLQARAQVRFVRSAWAVLLVLGLADALTNDVRAYGYRGPAWWLVLVHGRSELNGWIFRVKLAAELALLVLLLVLLAQRVLRARRPERRALIPVVAAAVAFVVANGIDVAGQIATSSLAVLTPGVLSNVAVLVLPVSALVSLAVRRVQRALAVEALLEPSRLRDADAVRVALARALGDRELTLALWSPERAEYLSIDGVPVTGEVPGRFAVDVASADGSPVARLGVDRRLADSRDLVEAMGRAASVALDNARLQAELRARQREAEESSRRLARAEYAEASLSRLVPGGLARRLRDDPEALERTERLTVTVLMSDIRGYSAIAERTAPADLAEQLNEHRAAMNAAILGAGGTVMQYVGDAVLAVFGAPEPQADHGGAALEAAAAMHAAQEELNARWSGEGRPAFGLGVGVCTGEVAAAFLGSRERVEYTVVGDTVNLAARLTDAARPAGATIASAATLDLDAGIGAWCAEALPPFHVKGRAASVSAFRLLRSTTAAPRLLDATDEVR